MCGIDHPPVHLSRPLSHIARKGTGIGPVDRPAFSKMAALLADESAAEIATQGGRVTKQEALEALAKIDGRLYSERGYDEEPAHVEADNVLVEFLRTLGHDDVADAFEAIPKWYA